MENKFNGLNPVLIDKVTQLLEKMKALGHPMKVVQGLRTLKEQQALYAQGRTAPGKVVTNCDGSRKKSNHQAYKDGLGRAVDCAFLDPNGKVTWEGPWSWYGTQAKLLGLVWGGDFKSLVDRPHIELPNPNL